MYSITELRKGTLVQISDTPYQVVDYQHSKQGRGGAVVRTKLKNLLDGSVIGQTFKGNEKVQAAELTRVNLQFLYQTGERLMLMDQANFDQIEVDQSVIAAQKPFLAEGTALTGLMFKGRLVAVELAAKVSLKVSQTEPGLRGDTSGTPLKPATLETGAQIKVPLFINQGDEIIVDTRTGTYFSRA